jgi:RNA polymerase sigma factor (sigma-70 family)
MAYCSRACRWSQELGSEFTKSWRSSVRAVWAKCTLRWSTPDSTRARREELRRRVWRAIAALPADHPEIMVLRDFHGLSYDELAQALGLKVGMVMSRLPPRGDVARAAHRGGC